jgi:transaldolase/glucose-6-phosphate isomerase
MGNNPVKEIQEYGQSIWLDYLRRGMIESGELQRLIEEDGLRGITSNPSIFEKAIDGSDDYTSVINSLAQEGGSAAGIYRILTVEDVQHAADIFRPTYDELDGRDGFISLEVSPHLARDAEGTVKEARELWKALNRPNVFIKVPATKEGLTSIRRLISEGINVNVTLLFGLERYREVADAYIGGLEDRLRSGDPIDSVSSVASFFLSRIDVLVDPMLEKIMNGDGERSRVAERLHGEIAVSSAKIAYQIYKEIFGGDRFKKLRDKGAGPQRVLWASTSTKNPDYSDIKYVEALIGPETVNTIPQETLNAYRDHGNPTGNRLEEDIDKAGEVIDEAEKLGISMKEVSDRLENEGIEKFNRPYDKTMETLEKKIAEAGSEPVDEQKLRPGRYEAQVSGRIKELHDEDFVQRLWRKDPTLWSDEERDKKVIKQGLGWLHAPEKMISAVPHLIEFASEVRRAGFKHVVHMGMGGSSLAPLVFQRSFPVGDSGLPLTVLDTTDPQTIMDIESGLPLDETLFIVASKSGTTAEAVTFMEYFYDKIRGIKKGRAGENFVAITDPGTPLAKTAEERGFRNLFLNYTDIGGRYSALSYFGMVPAALMGMDIGRFLEQAIRISQASQSCMAIERNPGAKLGAMLGELALQGRDKLTFIIPDNISAFGLWLEQLIAESTGKKGKGILPVAGESLGEPENYGDDRVFVLFEFRDRTDKEKRRLLRALENANHPVIVILLDGKYDLAQEMMRWEIATATAGAVIGINAFNQPNVQESKDNTDRLLEKLREEGSLPKEKPELQEGPLAYYGGGNAADSNKFLRAFLDKAEPGDYIALQAYITENGKAERLLQELRLSLRDGSGLATTAGYGPRFLHSTGQYHKGGPNKGLFIQLVCGVESDVDIPGREYSFGVLREAQALGDLEALRKHGRRVIRIDLGRDSLAGLKELKKRLMRPVSAS